MKLRSLIVDDEELARENLKMLLEDHCPEIEVIGTAENVSVAKDLITKESPDVVFLDIRMPSGSEGFELLESLDERQFMVVFVTAFKDYAIKAFNANAIHYILKPIDIDDLKTAVSKLTGTKQSFSDNPADFNNYVDTLRTLSQNLSSSSQARRIAINHSKGIKIIEDQEIIHLGASGNCTNIHFIDGSKYLDTRTLKIYEELLDENKFYRVHKSHIINLDYLREYLHDHGHFAVMKDESRIPVARNRLSSFLQRVRNI